MKVPFDFAITLRIVHNFLIGMEINLHTSTCVGVFVEDVVEIYSSMQAIRYWRLLERRLNCYFLMKTFRLC